MTAPPDPPLLDLAVATAREAAELVARGRATARRRRRRQVQPGGRRHRRRHRQRGADRRPAARRPARRRRAGGGGRARARAPAACAGWSTRSTAPSTSSTTCPPTRCPSPPRSTARCVAGVVLNVATGELFTATAGGGRVLLVTGRPEPVRLTGSRAGVAGADAWWPPASATGWSSGGRRAPSSPQLLPRVRDIRRHGSAALDLCAVAAGRRRRLLRAGPQPLGPRGRRARRRRGRAGGHRPARPPVRASRWRSRRRRRSPGRSSTCWRELHRLRRTPAAGPVSRRRRPRRRARARRRPPRRRGQASTNSGPMTTSTCSRRAGVEEVAGAGHVAARTKRGGVVAARAVPQLADAGDLAAAGVVGDLVDDEPALLQVGGDRAAPGRAVSVALSTRTVHRGRVQRRGRRLGRAAHAAACSACASCGLLAEDVPPDGERRRGPAPAGRSAAGAGGGRCGDAPGGVRCAASRSSPRRDPAAALRVAGSGRQRGV